MHKPVPGGFVTQTGLQLCFSLLSGVRMHLADAIIMKAGADAGRGRARRWAHQRRAASGMDLFLYAVFGLAATWALYVIYMQIATRASEGRSAAPLYSAIPTLEGQPGRVLVYFTSQHCAPCRPMSADVAALRAEGVPIHQLDINDHEELAREMGIRATPTLMLVEHASVSRVYLGVKSREAMRSLLSDTS